MQIQGVQQDGRASRPRLDLVWSGVARTKFRPPALLPDVVTRHRLLTRTCNSAMERHVTLVCAPAGAGKSTLLAQLVQACAGARSVWLSLDEADNDAAHLVASLLAALREVDLEWEVDPQTLGARVPESGVHPQAAIALLVNALCTFRGKRLLIVLDDLHRVNDPATLQWLNQLIERLPSHAGVVLGTRVMPGLSLSRWRLRGQLGELLAADLLFNAEEAATMAAGRFAQQPTDDLVSRALQRTHGWAAGLQLLLTAAARSPLANEAIGDRHLLDFLAHEVLAELPQDLKEFALECSLLAELSPSLCDALTERGDSRRLIHELHRRNLFVTMLDENAPTLRFHDFFREFLQGELERRSPQRFTVLSRRLAGRAIPAARAAAGSGEPLRYRTGAICEGHTESAMRTALRGLEIRAVPERLVSGGASDSLERLSARELEVLTFIAAGNSNKHIARALRLSLHTVKRHVANILAKLGASTRNEAAALCRRSA